MDATSFVNYIGERLDSLISLYIDFIVSSKQCGQHGFPHPQRGLVSSSLIIPVPVQRQLVLAV